MNPEKVTEVINILQKGIKIVQTNRYMISFHTVADARPRVLILSVVMNDLPNRDVDLANFMLQACATKVATDTHVLTPPNQIVIDFPLLLDIEQRMEAIQPTPPPTNAGE